MTAQRQEGVGRVGHHDGGHVDIRCGHRTGRQVGRGTPLDRRGHEVVAVALVDDGHEELAVGQLPAVDGCAPDGEVRPDQLAPGDPGDLARPQLHAGDVSGAEGTEVRIEQDLTGREHGLSERG